MEALTQAAHVLYPVEHPEDVGAVRRALSHTAADTGVDPARLGGVELVATELATNLLRHAHPGGWILARPVRTGDGCGMEMVSVDGGPGIRDLGAALQGRVPAPDEPVVLGQGLGCGLAAVRRLSTEFDVHTRVGEGTVVMSRILPRGAAPAPPRWAGVSVALEVGGECGDGWAVAEDGGRTTVLVVDGLGHGSAAAEAARAAVAVFSASSGDDLESLARRIHEAMRSTRGGAASLCRLDALRRRADYVGVGNVAGRLLGRDGSRAMLSLNGTLGTALSAPRIRQVSYDLDEGALLVMCSDGVREGFDVQAHRTLLDHDPLVIAAAIHRSCNRGNDDATVVVVRPALAEVAA